MSVLGFGPPAPGFPASGLRLSTYARARLGERALLLPHLPAHWPSVVDRPDSGTWLTAPTNTFNYWKGKGLLAFGLLKWLRNLFAHAGQIVGRGSFASRADINAYVENRFKWLPHKLAEFQLSDLPKLVIVHADKAVPDAHHADVDYPRRAVLGRE